MDALVIATNRLEQFKVWFDAWHDQMKQHTIRLCLMHDTENEAESERLWNDTKTPHIQRHVFNHNNVKKELQDKAWIIPKRAGACKSYAVYQAWKGGAERIYCLDDDCLPEADDFFAIHNDRLKSFAFNQLYFTLANVRPRGVPYLAPAPIMLNHGLWTNVPDVDALTQLKGYAANIHMKNACVPKQALFPFCGMNWACNGEILPLMYFGLQGPEWPVDRWDDIWCGFIAKKIMDHLGYAVWSGEPTINHSRASDSFVNLVKEASGYKMNCEFYEFAMNLQVEGGTTIECMKSAGQQLISWAKHKSEYKKYFEKYGEAIQVWASLFN